MNNAKYSIVMTVFNREELLLKTLDSFRHHGYGKNLEVVLVDDASIQPLSLDVSKYDFMVKIIRVEPSEKKHINPCVPYNRGFDAATGEIVIIQNAECYHKCNIINYLERNFQSLNGKYLSFACYSLTKEESLEDLTKFDSYINTPVRSDGVSGWYNHSKYRPVGYHFCSALKKNDLKILGGFDLEYADGSCFDDDEFLYRVRKILDLEIVDEAFVFHQWHYVSGAHYTNKSLALPFLRNKLLFELYTKKGFSALFVKKVVFPTAALVLTVKKYFK